MNLWECSRHDCNRKAVGVGGALGLRAIGWHFTMGGPLLCPVHRPDPIPCSDNDENAGKSCSRCAAEASANAAQELLTTDEDRARLDALVGQPLMIQL